MLWPLLVMALAFTLLFTTLHLMCDAQRNPAPPPAPPLHAGRVGRRGQRARASPHHAGGLAVIDHVGFIAVAYALSIVVDRRHDRRDRAMSIGA